MIEKNENLSEMKEKEMKNVKGGQLGIMPSVAINNLPQNAHNKLNNHHPGLPSAALNHAGNGGSGSGGSGGGGSIS